MDSRINRNSEFFGKSFNFYTHQLAHIRLCFVCRSLSERRNGLAEIFRKLELNQREIVMKLESLEILYVEELRDIYNAENQLLHLLCITRFY